ncbi:hypothetical protein PSPTOT1_0487 [Pseudomonas syringae pv. tomato T1]|nr:hypothetical protein PSPTOT1_0487 [Pseudomonas syringae pv. tomato T1]
MHEPVALVQLRVETNAEGKVELPKHGDSLKVIWKTTELPVWTVQVFFYDRVLNVQARCTAFHSFLCCK